MKALFIPIILSLVLLGCHGKTQPQEKFEEPARAQCYQECVVSYKGDAEGARNKCFRMASKYQEGRSCFGGHGP